MCQYQKSSTSSFVMDRILPKPTGLDLFVFFFYVFNFLHQKAPKGCPVTHMVYTREPRHVTVDDCARTEKKRGVLSMPCMKSAAGT